jgi:25S rRNA (uracil2634-N3)-methyltransferase
MMLKYSRAATNLRELEELGCTIMHGVDAHTMSKHPLLNQKFDRIVYNFPAPALKRRESNTRQIKSVQLRRSTNATFRHRSFDVFCSQGINGRI